MDGGGEGVLLLVIWCIVAGGDSWWCDLIRLMLLFVLLQLLSVSETGVVASSQSFPTGGGIELFKLLVLTPSVSLHEFELLELEFILHGVLSCVWLS